MELQSLRERRRALIEEDILRVAQELIVEKGYAAMSMDELATRVGISKPTLYGFFDTKADLAVAAARRGFGAMLARVEQELNPNDSPLDQLATMMRVILLHHHEEGIPALVASMPELMAVVGSHNDVCALKQRLVDRIISLVRRSQEAGQINPQLDPQVIGFAFRGLIMSYFHVDHNVTFDQPLPDGETMANGLTEIFIRGIRYPSS